MLFRSISAKDLYGMKISHLNVGSNEEISIKELALLIKKIVGFSGELVFNNKYPDGMLRKLLDAKKIINLGWVSKIKLKDGIKSVYQWYLDNMRTD